MSVENYARAMQYELLIRKAFDCPSGARNGAHLSFMQNVMDMEQGQTYAKQAGSYKKQYEKVLKYLSKALVKLSKKKPYSNDADFFLSLNHQANFAGSTKYLMIIVDNALEKVKEYKTNAQQSI